jgi:hypothetical protein
MKKYFSLESVFAFLIGATLLAGSIAPTPYRFLVSPPDKIYNGTTESWSDDYSAYVSYIIQGQQGKWLACDTHTSEPNLSCIPIHSEYVLWGKLTGLLGINPIISYQLFRFSLGAVLLFLIWKLIKLTLPDSPSRLIAFFLVCFIGGFPKFDPSFPVILQIPIPALSGVEWVKFQIDAYIPWITELGVFFRFISLPHYLLGNIFFVLSLVQFLKLQKHGLTLHTSHFALLILFGLLTGSTHAVSLVFLYTTFGLFIFLKTTILISTGYFKKFNALIHHLASHFSLLISFIILTCPILLYFKSLLALQPWANLSAAWEATTQYYIPPGTVIPALGPTLLLAPIGFLLLVVRRMTKNDVPPSAEQVTAPLLLFSWPLSFFLLFYFSYPFLHISQVRFFQSYFLIALGILSAPVIVSLAQQSSLFVSRYLLPAFQISNFKFQIKPLITSVYFYCLLFTSLVSLPTLPLLIQNFSFRFPFFAGFDPLIYPPKDWVAAIYWLRDHTNHNSVVLSAWQAGHAIPFMAGNYVYYGHMWGTLNLQEKMDTSAAFYRNQMTLDQAKQFLKGGNIDYVFWGYEEKSLGGTLDKYQKLLTPIFDSPAATIYQVAS